MGWLEAEVHVEFIIIYSINVDWVASMFQASTYRVSPGKSKTAPALFQWRTLTSGQSDMQGPIIKIASKKAMEGEWILLCSIDSPGNAALRKWCVSEQGECGRQWDWRVAIAQIWEDFADYVREEIWIFFWVLCKLTGGFWASMRIKGSLVALKELSTKGQE